MKSDELVKIDPSEARAMEYVVVEDELGRREVYWDARTVQWRKCGGEVASFDGYATFYRRA